MISEKEILKMLSERLERVSEIINDKNNVVYHYFIEALKYHQTNNDNDDYITTDDKLETFQIKSRNGLISFFQKTTGKFLVVISLNIDCDLIEHSKIYNIAIDIDEKFKSIVQHNEEFYRFYIWL